LRRRATEPRRRARTMRSNPAAPSVVPRPELATSPRPAMAHRSLVHLTSSRRRERPVAHQRGHAISPKLVAAHRRVARRTRSSPRARRAAQRSQVRMARPATSPRPAPAARRPAHRTPSFPPRPCADLRSQAATSPSPVAEVEPRARRTRLRLPVSTAKTPNSVGPALGSAPIVRRAYPRSIARNRRASACWGRERVISMVPMGHRSVTTPISQTELCARLARNAGPAMPVVAMARPSVIARRAFLPATCKVRALPVRAPRAATTRTRPTEQLATMATRAPRTTFATRVFAPAPKSPMAHPATMATDARSTIAARATASGLDRCGARANPESARALNAVTGGATPARATVCRIRSPMARRAPTPVSPTRTASAECAPARTCAAAADRVAWAAAAVGWAADQAARAGDREVREAVAVALVADPAAPAEALAVREALVAVPMERRRPIAINAANRIVVRTRDSSVDAPPTGAAPECAAAIARQRPASRCRSAWRTIVASRLALVRRL